MLTKRATEILCIMKAAEEAERWEDSEIVCDGLSCWLGDEMISRRTVRHLLDYVAVSHASEPGSTDRYTISGSGRAMLADPAAADRIWIAVRKGINVDEAGHPIDIDGKRIEIG